MKRWTSSAARLISTGASDRDYAPEFFPQITTFFPQFPQTPEIVFRISDFLFHSHKKTAYTSCIHKNVDLHCTHFRAGRSMADVNGAKASFETRWVEKRTRRERSFADVNAS
jgi:hypothetical protein